MLSHISQALLCAERCEDPRAKLAIERHQTLQQHARALVIELAEIIEKQHKEAQNANNRPA